MIVENGYDVFKSSLLPYALDNVLPTQLHE